MKLTTKGRYAIAALADMAAQGKGKVISLSDISTRQSISTSYLEQLFRQLRQADIVDSHRGAMGGYSLTAGPSQINLAQIIFAVNEDLRLHSCTPEVQKRCTGTSEKCLTHPLWDALEGHIESFFSGITLADVLAQDFSALDAA